jgi:predicted CopG family antitoxin
MSVILTLSEAKRKDLDMFLHVFGLSSWSEAKDLQLLLDQLAHKRVPHSNRVSDFEVSVG